MEQEQGLKIIGVRFGRVGKIYHFDATSVPDVRPGDMVVVETSRGVQLGEVVNFVADVDNPPEGGWKPVDRIANPRDLIQRQIWADKESSLLIASRAKLAELKISGVKITSVEFSFDGSRLVIFYAADSDDKVDLKSLRQDMQRMVHPTQVELRQVGPRDVAKCMGGMGACGLEKRCCALFLTEFSSISIRMAKEQGISLTPDEITGMCGRLRCCLIYEYEQYVEARKTLPKKNKRVMTPHGEGKVVDVFPMRNGVLVDIPDQGRREYPFDQLQPLDELENLERKATSPGQWREDQVPGPNKPSGGDRRRPGREKRND